MTVEHSIFTVERTYDASPQRVFTAFADPAQKARWFGPEDAESTATQDFRVGGAERLRVQMTDGPVFRYDAVYQDIVTDQRIVYTYDMHIGDQRMSVSVATVELTAAGTGTRLVLTEQGAFLDGLDRVEMRQKGTEELMDKLGATLD